MIFEFENRSVLRSVDNIFLCRQSVDFPRSAKHIHVCQGHSGSLFNLLCVCDGGDGSLTLAHVADTRPLAIRGLLP